MKKIALAITAAGMTVGAAFGMGPAYADVHDGDGAGYDMTTICRSERENGREFAIDLVQLYYGVSESTAVRVVGDCPHGFLGLF